MKSMQSNDVNIRLESDNINLLNDQNIDKSEVSSRENGYLGGVLGGEMTKRLVEMGKKDIIKKYRG